MRRVKVPGLDIQIPPGSAFKIETPPMMPKMHLLAAVVAPRGYGKGVITTNLIEQLKVVDRLILVSPSAASNKALNDRLKQIFAPEDMFDNPNDISVLFKVRSLDTLNIFHTEFHHDSRCLPVSVPGRTKDRSLG